MDTKLDGFVIIGGKAGSIFYSESIGGGMVNCAGSPTLSNLIFIGNKAADGGGLFNDYGREPTISNTVFLNNWASGSGGGIFNSTGSMPWLINVTFSGNIANSMSTIAGCGALFNKYYGMPVLINVIM